MNEIVGRLEGFIDHVREMIFDLLCFLNIEQIQIIIIGLIVYIIGYILKMIVTLAPKIKVFKCVDLYYIRIFILMMLKFYQPFLFRYGSTNNSPSPNRFMPCLKLSDEAQQALISHHTFSIIMTSEPNNYFMHQCSLRQKILDRKYFKQSFLSTIKSENKLGMKNEQLNMNWLDGQFAEKNYDQVFKGFQISSGAPYNQDIFPQSRMFQTSINGYIALFPVPSNRIYYRMVFNTQSGIISGNKGTGKSLSLFSIIYFNQFMVRFMTHNYFYENGYFQFFVKQKFWNIVPYICYIHMDDKTNYNFYFVQIMLQFTYLYPIKQIIKDFNISQQPKDHRQMTKQQLITLLRMIKSKALKNKNIKTFCFMDEANQIFRLFRQLKVWIIQNKHLPNFIKQQLWKNTTFYKDLVFYYELLDIFTDEQNNTSFDNIIFNSSQHFQLQLFQDSLIPPQVKQSLQLLRLFKDRRLFGKRKTSNTGTNNTAGVFQLYQILWFEIIKNLERRYLLKNKQIDLTYQSKLKEHKKCFNKTFGLDNFPNYSANKDLKMVDWYYQITHLNIRQYFTKHQGYQLSFLSNTNNIFSYQNPTQQQLTLFSKQLQLLKEKIQKCKIDSISEDIIKYISRGVSYLAKFQREDYIRQILTKAKQILKNNKQGQKGSSQTNKNQEYLKGVHLTLTAAKIQLVETIKIGYVYEGKLKFNMKPQDLIHAISQTLVSDRFYQILAQNMVSLVLDPATKTINRDIGKILNRLSYPIFKDGNLKLLYAQRKLQQGKKIINIQKIQQIGETCFIDSISGNQYKNGIFDKVIEAANNNIINQYTAGYPVIYASNNKVPSQNNMTFDCMIARKVQKKNQAKDKYKFLFYDMTFGRPGSKERGDFIAKIKKYLEMAKIKADIECKLLIVAPQFFVDSYVNQYEKTYLSFKQSQSNSTNQQKLFLKEEHIHEIEGVQYKWDISVGLASFNEYRPFYSPNRETQTKKIIGSAIQKCYSQIQKKFYQQVKKSRSMKN